MAFSYFPRLSPRLQKIYLQSDRIVDLPIPRPDLLEALVAGLRLALEAEDRRATELAAGFLVKGLTEMLKAPPVRVEVLAARPRSSSGELHGLYTRGSGQARIQVWMRTAAHKRVVAFRTFLRTLVHEVGHHLDYTYLRLGDSLHTEGFFRRESSLVRQLLGEASPKSADRA